MTIDHNTTAVAIIAAAVGGGVAAIIGGVVTHCFPRISRGKAKNDAPSEKSL